MRRVLITGAGSGLGAALTQAFRDRGDEVLATDIADGDDIDLVLDITKPADWEDAVEAVDRRWGGLDILVNNAGVAGGGRLDVGTLEEWRWITEINLFGVVQGMQEFIPVFKKQRSGHIVNVASLAGLVHPAGMASYNAVKAAVVALSETAGHELSPYGVRVSAVCPSYFRTNLMDSIRGADEGLAGVIRSLVEASPFTAEQIAKAVLEGIERGDDVIVPDPAAQAAYALKWSDRPAYDAQMRRQAAKLDALP